MYRTQNFQHLTPGTIYVQAYRLAVQLLRCCDSSQGSALPSESLASQSSTLLTLHSIRKILLMYSMRLLDTLLVIVRICSRPQVHCRTRQHSTVSGQSEQSLGLLTLLLSCTQARESHTIVVGQSTTNVGSHEQKAESNTFSEYETAGRSVCCCCRAWNLASNGVVDL